MTLIWTLLSFLIGALPLSLWIGRLASVDIRQVGDGNPGATNVLRAAGVPLFILALAADISKGAFPVGMAYQIFGWHGWPMALIAFAPPLGHAFSPFLGGRGGKALAACLGVWIGLTLWRVPLVSLVSLTLAFALLTISGWAVLVALAAILAYLLRFNPDPLLLVVWLGQLLLILWTHRADLVQRPRLRWPRQAP